MPSISTFSRTISRAKKCEETIINNATDTEILEVTEIYTLKGCDFLLHDSKNGKQRFFMYATKKNLKQLKECKLWFADGTFKCVPTILHQLYTIHGFLKVQSETNRYMCVPLVYFLLPNKKKDIQKCLECS